MAYNEYKNSGRTLGRILYQLDQIHIPLRIVEEVVLVSSGTLMWYGKDFATIEWLDGDIPYFTFSKEHHYFQNNQDIYANRQNHFEVNNFELQTTDSEKKLTIQHGKIELTIALTKNQIIISHNNSDVKTLHPNIGDALMSIGSILKVFKE